MANEWRYWRILAPDDNGGGGLAVCDITFRIGGVNQIGGGSAFGTAQWIAAQIPNAFDGNAGTICEFTSFGGYGPNGTAALGYDFGAGNEKAIDSATWNNNGVIPENGRSPSIIIVQCSEDGSAWTNVFSATGLTWVASETKTWSFTAPIFIPDGIAETSQFAALTVYEAETVPRLGLFGAYATYVGPRGKSTRDSTFAAYVVYEMNPNNIPRDSTYAAYVVWTESHGAEARTRAWTYTLDGHIFYVLDLGEEGTFEYDLTTGQWAQFQTAGYSGWNIRAGTMWGEDNRIVGGDTLYHTVWELDPDTFTDDGFRAIEHVAVGGVMTRSRVHHAVEALRIAGSLGYFTSGSDAVITLRYSDDNGKTWLTAEIQTVEQGVPLEVAWRSLGSFMAPGRVFEISDVGGMFRIDGADVYIENFDEDGT